MITLAMAAITGITVVASIVFAFIIFKYNMNHALTLDKDGEVLPLQWIERKKVLYIEIKDHLDKWFSSYYTYDQNNMEQQREKALWLVSAEDGKRLEDYYRSQGWFNDVVKYGIVQKTSLEVEKIQVYGNNEPFTFYASAIMEISRGQTKDVFRLEVTGAIGFVSPSWPWNPHGMLITNYQEKPLVKIN